MKRRSWLIAVVIVCVVAGRLLAATSVAPLSAGRLVLLALLLVIPYPAFGIGVGSGVLGPFLARRKRRPADYAWVYLLVGIVFSLPLLRQGGFALGEQGAVVHPTYELSIVGLNGILLFLFTGATAAMQRALATVPAIRFKFLAVGMASCFITLAISDLAPRIGLVPDATWPIHFGFLFLAVGSIVSGFCMMFAEGLTTWFARALPEIEAFGEGRPVKPLDESPKDETGAFARAFNAAVAQRRDAQFLERAFGRYVAPAVLAALRRNREELKLDGGFTLASRRVDATVLYADIRGFTKFSESESPEEVMRVLNVYFERMIDVIGQHEGYINKFIGDAVMVVFGAPLEQPDHASRSVRCAAAMQEALAAMNAAQAFGPARIVEIGIGVNTGALVAGSLGSDTRAEYTVIGDTVNVAARLTSSAKPGEILVGASTAGACGVAGLEPQPPLTVKGKSQPLEVFRLGPAAKAAARA